MSAKILIVDDDLDTLRLVGLLLQRKGYEIYAADNGVQAIEKARMEHPDLILLDVMMPEMDGIEVLRRLRAMTDTADIPIIMFTAKSQVEDKVIGFETGADDYLTKPTHPAELTARVRTILARSAGRKDPEKNEAGKREKGMVVSVIGAKGGLGVTTVAVNLAIAFKQHSPNSVALAELVPGMGSMGLMLGLPENDNLIPLLRKEASAISEIDLQNSMTEHDSGLAVLASSYQAGDSKYRSSGEQMGAIATKLAYLYDRVIVDLGSGFPPSSEKVIEKTDSIVVVIDPIMVTITQTKALLDELRMKVLGLGAIKIVLVNRVKLENQLSPREIQNHLGHSIDVSIAPIPDLAYQSLGLGVPISLLSPDDQILDPYRKIVEAIMASTA